jgi:hypothetical protein
MSHPPYKLLFRDVEIGTIHQKDADFPNVWGSFEPSIGTDHPDTREHIQRYMEYSREAGRLMEQDPGGGEWDDFVAQNELQFLDLIECVDWWLVDATGERHPILVPIFYVDGVAWRWDTTPGRQRT